MHPLDDSLLQRMLRLGAHGPVSMPCFSAHHGSSYRRATAHGWGQAPVNSSQLYKAAARKKYDLQIDDLFLQVESIRWLLIDECTALAAMVLGVVDTNMRRVRARHV